MPILFRYSQKNNIFNNRWQYFADQIQFYLVSLVPGGMGNFIWVRIVSLYAWKREKKGLATQYVEFLNVKVWKRYKIRYFHMKHFSTWKNIFYK